MDSDIRDQIIFEIQRVAKELNCETLSRSEFVRLSNISTYHIDRNFGSWNNAVLEAGLSPHTKNEKKSPDELLQNLYNVCLALDQIPTTIGFTRNSNNDTRPYRKNFGSWQDALYNLKIWLQENHPDSKFINALDDEKQEEISMQTPQSNGSNSGMVWEGKKGVVYGAPLDYKGLRHEPTNEQGVVFLFGKINEELGIIVEAVKTGFPDCVGKRLIDGNKNLWEPVSIEFEYRSKNFLAHGHDASKCDVIVCWVHDWQECPLEVIELKSIIASDRFQDK